MKARVLAALLLAAPLASVQAQDGDPIRAALPKAQARHAPLLFPIVGRLKSDQLHHGGRSYPMTQHGFARDSRFEWVERRGDFCRLKLSDNCETRSTTSGNT